jgi:hypothetical protein
MARQHEAEQGDIARQHETQQGDAARQHEQTQSEADREHAIQLAKMKPKPTAKGKAK